MSGDILKRIAEPSLQVVGYVVLAVMFLYILTPLVWMFLTAFNPEGGPFLELPKEFTLDNFVMIFMGEPIKGRAGAAHPFYMTRWIQNSFFIASVALLLVVTMASMAAYSLSRLDFPGKSLLMTFILLIGFMPSMAKILPLFKLCLMFGFVDNLFGVAVVIASSILPTQIWILKGFFDSIPRELEEQAWVCGCGRFTTLMRVVLPVAGPGIAVVALLSFLGAWGSFTIPLILIRSEDLYPISLGIASVFIHNPGEIGLAVDYGPLCALSIVYAIPSLAIYYLTRKYLMQVRLGKMEVR
ncbi:MAG: hypothetical protein DRJ37_02025 [Thermoprotei archaeon]|nr:MAG: hypothetical protein DRJ37_02025 [Thermoprotei archaeon]